MRVWVSALLFHSGHTLRFSGPPLPLPAPHTLSFLSPPPHVPRPLRPLRAPCLGPPGSSALPLGSLSRIPQEEPGGPGRGSFKAVQQVMLGVGFEPRTLCLEHELPAPSTLGCGLHTLLSHSRSLLQALQNCPRPLSWAFSADRGPLPGVGIKGCPCASPTPGAELSVRPPSCWPPRGGGCLSHPLSSSACLMPSFPSPEPPSLPLFLVSPTCLNRPPHPPPHRELPLPHGASSLQLHTQFWAWIHAKGATTRNRRRVL